MSAFYFWGIVSIYAIEYIGMGHYIPGAQKIPLFLSIIIFLALVTTEKAFEVLKHKQSKAISVFLIHTTLSMTYAYVTLYAFNVVKLQVGYVILFISTYMVIRNRQQVMVFLRSFTLFHVLIILTNLPRMNLTQRTGGFRAGYFLGDGNDLAWSLAIFFPFIIYLYLVENRKFMRAALIGAGVIFLFGIVGTSSRGAFLAMSGALAYLVLKSRRKALAITAAVFMGLVTLVLAPGSYLDRIQSIGSYQEDSSSLGRIMAWKAAMRMAVGDPLGVGAGNFNTAYGRKYRPQQVDERIYAGSRWISPHSVYFLVLGEYGIIGLITILTLLYANYKDNQQQVKVYDLSDKRLRVKYPLLLLPKFLNTSMVAFAVGGAFLGGINYPHIYLLTALILRIKQMNGEAAELPQA